MPLRAARLLIWPIAVAAFALRICAELWIEPVTWRIDPRGVALLVWIAAQAACFLVPWAAYALLTRSVRQRPATWEVDAGRRCFIAPASPRWIGPWSILLGWLAGGFVPTERVPGEDRLRLADIPGTVALGIGIPVLVLGGIAAVLLMNRPLLALDRDGITMQGIIRRSFLPWNRLLAGGPMPPARGAANLTLMRLPATPGGRAPVGYPLPIARLHVDPAFLAHTIRHYVEHPEHRPAIGAADERERLRAAQS
ncbi:hypothetical protein ACGGAQ_10965 [Micromonospora sp. NPDC047557]|uniref:hypothetical protein n=1 Tax=Micromonospora sp. NPDC047557 TaxID=3364250 RepID=UPI003716699C